MQQTNRLGVCVAMVGLFGPAMAAAQDSLGASGQVAVSAERMFGVVHTTTTAEEEGVDGTDVEVSVSATSLSLFAREAPSPFSGSRIALDFFPMDGLSVGLAIGAYTTSVSTEAEAGSASEEADVGTLSGFGIAPRIGYAYMFDDVLGIWPKIGVTYAAASFEPENVEPDPGDLAVESIGSSAFALSLEVPLVVSPAEHVAFTIAPTLDFGLSGKLEVETSDGTTEDTAESEPKTMDVGLQFGIATYF
jgi:hypothetical protein